jgi:hypothetical protein
MASKPGAAQQKAAVRKQRVPVTVGNSNRPVANSAPSTPVSTGQGSQVNRDTIRPFRRETKPISSFDTAQPVKRPKHTPKSHIGGEWNRGG